MTHELNSVTMNGWQGSAVWQVLSQSVGSGDNVDAVTIELASSASIAITIVSVDGVHSERIGPTGERSR